MRYEDQRLLLAFAKLMLRVSRAQHPEADVDVTEATVHQSDGYKRLREFFMRLSPRKREGMRVMMRNQVNGVRDILAKTGEAITLADIEFDMRDAETGQQVPDKPNVQIETAENDNTTGSSET